MKERFSSERAVSIYAAVTRVEVKTCKAVTSGSYFSVRVVVRDLLRCASLCENHCRVSAARASDLGHNPAGEPPRAFLLSEVTQYVAGVLGEFGIQGYSSGEVAGNAESRAAALQAFAGFRYTVRDCAKAGMAGAKDPRDALKDILQAADRCLPAPAFCMAHHAAAGMLKGCVALKPRDVLR